MRKFYFLLVMLCLICGRASAEIEVITSVGEHITSASQLYAGQKVAFFCYGPTDPTASMYGTRNAYVMEDDYQNLYINKNLTVGSSTSSDYIWTILSCEVDNNTAYITLQSPKGNYLPNFVSNSGTYYGITCQSIDSIGTMTVTAAESDSIFYISDEAGIYFNGNNTSSTGSAAFVGWGETGSNSNYMIFPLETELTSSFTATLILLDHDENEVGSTREQTIALGSIITAPEIENYSFDYAEDYDTGESIELPDTVDVEGDVTYVLYYTKWPLVSTMCYDTEGNYLYSIDEYVEKGTTYTPPTLNNIGFGYELITHDYDNMVIEEDTEVFLYYQASATGGLPFTPTTVSDGQFADGTKYYFMKIRSGYIYYNNAADTLYVSNTVSDPTLVDNYVWAVTGNITDGFEFYNKALGTTYKMYAPSSDNGAYIGVATDETIAAAEAGTSVFDLAFNMDGTTYGYSLAYSGTANACLNRYGGSTGAYLRFWNSSYSPTDVGSRIVFEELSAEQVEAYKLSTYQAYLNAQDCVGGWTAEQLSGLQSAVSASDLDACATAVAALATADTIAFDASKTYNLISAYGDFAIYQPGVTYAIYADATDSVRWGAIDATSTTDDSYLWVFTAVSDTAYSITNVAQNAPIASFRFGDYAALVGTAEVEEPESTDICPVGTKADFCIVKSSVAPAAFRLVHNYGASTVTLSAQAGTGDGTATGGSITTYNTTTAGYSNIWRLKAIGEIPTGIDKATIVDENTQNGAVYDLSGRRVNKAAKGIYIMNGKKVLVK